MRGYEAARLLRRGEERRGEGGDVVTRYLVLRVEDEEPELLDPDVVAYTEWTGPDPLGDEAAESFGRILRQAAEWSYRQD